MILWALLMLSILVLALAGIIYVISRIYKFMIPAGVLTKRSRCHDR